MPANRLPRNDRARPAIRPLDLLLPALPEIGVGDSGPSMLMDANEAGRHQATSANGDGGLVIDKAKRGAYLVFEPVSGAKKGRIEPIFALFVICCPIWTSRPSGCACGAERERFGTARKGHACSAP